MPSAHLYQKLPAFIYVIKMNLKYKIPNKEEYPEVIDAVYQLFIQGKISSKLFWILKKDLM